LAEFDQRDHFKVRYAAGVLLLYTGCIPLWMPSSACLSLWLRKMHICTLRFVFCS